VQAEADPGGREGVQVRSVPRHDQPAKRAARSAGGETLPETPPAAPTP
jgi:hypothetical protein